MDFTKTLVRRDVTGWGVGEVPFFTDCNLQRLQFAALVEMRPPIPPPGPYLPAERPPRQPEQLCYFTPILAPLIW